MICQKPMAPSLAEAEQMVSVCREHRYPSIFTRTGAGRSRSGNSKVIASGEIGEPFRAHIFLVSGYPVFRNEPALKELEHFILADMGVHLLDVCRFLFGEADQIYCQTHQVQDGIKGEDAATVMLRMEGGMTVTCSWVFPATFWSTMYLPRP